MDSSDDLFVLYRQYPDGGKVWLMPGLDQSRPDYKDIMAIAERLAQQGHEVKILHAVHYKDPLYREVFGELNGLAQSDRIIIRQCNLTDAYMTQQIQGQINNGVPVLSVWIFDGNLIRELYNTEG